MLQQEILPLLRTYLPSNVAPKRLRYRVFGFGESNLQQILTESFPDWPDEIELGFRATMPLLELKLKVDYSEHHVLLSQWDTKIKSLLGDHIVTEDARPLAQVVIDLLTAQNKTITLAESCTGGKIASMITEISGASSVFEAGFVSYSNAIKHQLLEVSEADLLRDGAVSQVVVEQMLLGALRKSGANYGVSVSGIAGPGGGSDEKPVGTVWLAWGCESKMHSRQFYFPGNRVFFQQIVAALALDLIRRELIASDQQPVYFMNRQKKA